MADAVPCTPSELGYVDADADGFGAGEEVQYCEGAVGYASVGGDCADDDASVHPDATEVPGDGVDSNCDGTERCYVDADGDGVSANHTANGTVESAALECDAPGLLAAASDEPDCDDSRPDVYPGAAEVCNDVDDNCDGEVDEGLLIDVWPDIDNDGFGDENASPAQRCSVAEFEADNGLDCDDAEPRSTPSGDEVCDGVDNNCDGVIDLDAEDREQLLVDRDEDGFGGAQELICPGTVAVADDDGDCNDEDASIYPDAPEVDGLGIDANCDGRVRCYQDFDRDGSASTRLIQSGDDTCEGPFEAVEADVGPDCNDSDMHVYPGAPDPVLDGVDQDCSDTPYFEREPYDAYRCDEVERETCDGYDNDCDGVVDNDFACPEEGIVPAMDFDGEWWGVGWIPLSFPLGPPRAPVLFNALDLESGRLFPAESVMFDGDWARWSNNGEELILSQNRCVDTYSPGEEVDTSCGPRGSGGDYNSAYVVEPGLSFYANERTGEFGEFFYTPGLWRNDERLWDMPSRVVPVQIAGMIPVITSSERLAVGPPRITVHFVDLNGELVESYPYEWANSSRISFNGFACDAYGETIVCNFQIRATPGLQRLGLVFDREAGWRVFARTSTSSGFGVEALLPDGRMLFTELTDSALILTLRSSDGTILSDDPDPSFSWYFESATMMAPGTVPPIVSELLEGEDE